MEEPSVERSSGTNLNSILETARRVLTDPRGFFSTLPREGGFEEPGMFAAAMLIATAILYAVLSLVGLYPAGFFASLILTPIFGAIGLLVAAAILLFASRALGGEASFESSARIVAYASAILPVQAVFSIIPYLPLLASAYGMYIAIVAVITVHRVAEDRAWMVLGGLGALLLAFSYIATVTAQRAATRLETFGTQMQRSAEDLERATEQWRREMEGAAQKMKREQAEDEDLD